MSAPGGSDVIVTGVILTTVCSAPLPGFGCGGSGVFTSALPLLSGGVVALPLLSGGVVALPLFGAAPALPLFGGGGCGGVTSCAEPLSSIATTFALPEVSGFAAGSTFFLLMRTNTATAAPTVTSAPAI